MLLRNNHRHTGMDLRDEFVGLACNNRAGAYPLSRFGIFPVFQGPSKGEGAVVFHSDRERQLRFSRFPPFVEAIRRNQAAALYECLTVGRGFIDGLSSALMVRRMTIHHSGNLFVQSPQKLRPKRLNSCLRSLLLHRNSDGLKYTVLVLKIRPIEPQFATASWPSPEPLRSHSYLP